MLMKMHHTATVLFLAVCVPTGAVRAEATKTTQDLFLTVCLKGTETSAPEFSLEQRQTFCICKFDNLASSLSNQEIVTLISSYKKQDSIDLPQRIYDIDNKSSDACFKSPY